MLEIQFPVLFYVCFKVNQKQKLVTKNKMENPTFDEEDIPLSNQDADYDDYTTPDTSKIDEISFTVPDTTEATSTNISY